MACFLRSLVHINNTNFLIAAEDDPVEPIENQRDQSLDFDMGKGDALRKKHLQEQSQSTIIRIKVIFTQ